MQTIHAKLVKNIRPTLCLFWFCNQSKSKHSKRKNLSDEILLEIRIQLKNTIFFSEKCS